MTERLRTPICLHFRDKLRCASTAAQGDAALAVWRRSLFSWMVHFTFSIKVHGSEFGHCRRKQQWRSHWCLQQHLISPEDVESSHWRPVSSHADFTLLLLVFKALRGLAPGDIAEMLLLYEPGRLLTSTRSSLLVVESTQKKQTFGKTAFNPKPWKTVQRSLE